MDAGVTGILFIDDPLSTGLAVFPGFRRAKNTYANDSDSTGDLVRADAVGVSVFWITRCAVGYRAQLLFNFTGDDLSYGETRHIRLAAGNACNAYGSFGFTGW